MEGDSVKIKKMIAPIIITIVLIIYFAFFALGLVYVSAPSWVKVVGLVIPLILMGVWKQGDGVTASYERSIRYNRYGKLGTRKSYIYKRRIKRKLFRLNI